MNRREGIIFYRDWWEALQNLPDNMQLAAFRAICLYGFDSMKPEDVVVDSMTKLMQTAIDRDTKKWENTREKRRAAVNARWNKTDNTQQPQRDENIHMNANEYKCIHMNANEYKCINPAEESVKEDKICPEIPDTNEYKCIHMNTNEYKCNFCNTNDTININSNININNNINKERERDARVRVREGGEGRGGVENNIFDECCELFTSEAEREYQNIIELKYGVSDLRQAFSEFREILIERHLLSEVKNSQDFSRLFIYKYCRPRQKQSMNNKHGTINRQSEFAQYIADKLAAPDTPEPDISNNY